MDRHDGLENPRHGLGALPLPVLRRIDELADAYEAALLAGDNPPPDDFVEQLAEGDDAAREVLRKQLQDIGHEAAQSETPNLSGATSRSALGQYSEAEPTERLADLDQAIEELGVIGEYQLMERLGSGGMGVVYKALHLRLGCHVAIKFPRFAALLDPSHTQRLLREARVIGRLRHEHIVRALDAGVSPLGPYLVTEFISGGTVSELVRSAGPLPVEKAIELMRQAAEALDYSHKAGVVHRDIKPSNLLLDEGQVIRLVDFGLAKPQDLAETDPDASEATQSGAFLGTVAYAAPEQVMPGDGVDERADQYSLGCVLHFMLTGRPPHGATLPERLLAERGSIASSLSRHCPEVPVRVDRLWRRTVAHDPDQRFADMPALIEELERVRANPGPSAKLVATRRRVLAAGLAAALVGAVALFAASSQSSDASAKATRGPRPPAMQAPFTAEQATAAQGNWATYLQQPVQVTNSIGMGLVLIPPGEYRMGGSEGDPESTAEPDSWRFKSVDEVRAEQSPAHRVVLTQPFYLGATEVTFEQFGRFVSASGYVSDAERTSGWGKEDRGWLKRAGYSWKNTGQRVSEDDYPVVNVSWNDAVALCGWLTENDGRGTYRLPSEAEWEYACRAGTTAPYYFGDDPTAMGDHAWFAGNFGSWIHPVATKQPNPFGLYDLYGNRQEWCRDSFQSDFYARSPETDPVCLAEGPLRSLRGGAHTDETWFCTSARRWGQEPDDIGAAGIRVLCESTPDE